MSHYVSIRTRRGLDGRWHVDVYVDGELHDRVEASSSNEAQAILDDIVGMATQSGGREVVPE